MASLGLVARAMAFQGPLPQQAPQRIGTRRHNTANAIPFPSDLASRRTTGIVGDRNIVPEHDVSGTGGNRFLGEVSIPSIDHVAENPGQIKFQSIFVRNDGNGTARKIALLLSLATRKGRERVGKAVPGLIADQQTSIDQGNDDPLRIEGVVAVVGGLTRERNMVARRCPAILGGDLNPIRMDGIRELQFQICVLHRFRAAQSDPEIAGGHPFVGIMRIEGQVVGGRKGLRLEERIERLRASRVIPCGDQHRLRESGSQRLLVATLIDPQIAVANADLLTGECHNPLEFLERARIPFEDNDLSSL